jgi:hypothetical protein
MSSRRRHPRTLCHCCRCCCCYCCVCACVNARDARLCVYSTSRLSDIVVLLFCMCVPRGIHLLFVAVVVVVVVVVCRALVCTRMASLSSCCDLRDRRCAAGLSSGIRRQVPVGCLVVSLRGHSHTVVCVSDSMQCADWLSFDLI